MRLSLPFALVLALIACSGENYSMLMQASRFGDTPNVWKHAAEGGDVNERTRDGKTPLILAAAGGHAKTVEALLDLGADVNAQDNVGSTALLVAATAGHADVVRTLLTRNANAGLKDRDGGAPLLNAVFYGYREAVAELLKRNQTIPPQDMNEALLIAAGMGHTGIMEDMITVGVDVNVAGRYGRTPLMAAIKFERVDAVRSLLKSGARPDIKNDDGETAQTLARSSGNDEILKLLAEAAATPAPTEAPPATSATGPTAAGTAQSPPLP